MSTADVRVYVDPECPFCWMTATWLCKVVAPARNLNVEMRPISLWMRNEGRDLDPDYMAEKLPSLKLLRLLMALEQVGGNELFQRGYFELGRSNFHPDEAVRIKPSTVNGLPVFGSLPSSRACMTSSREMSFFASIVPEKSPQKSPSSGFHSRSPRDTASRSSSRRAVKS